MSGLPRHLLAGVLAAYLLAFGAVAYPQTVGHAAHHAHHHGAMHSPALCGWLCAAGHAIEPFQAPYAVTFHPTPSFPLHLVTPESLRPAPVFPPRGPPFS